MIKRIILGSLIGIILIAALLYIFAGKRERVVDSMFRAIPLDAAYIVDVSDYNELHQSLMSGNSLWNKALDFSFFKDLNIQLHLLDSLQQVSDVIKIVLSQKHSVLVSGHQEGKDRFQSVFYFKIQSGKDFKNIDNGIQKSKNLMSAASREYEKAVIQDIKFAGNQNEGFSYTWIDGMMIMSRSPLLVEDAVRQLSATESILNKNGLSEIVKTAGKSSVINFYLNFEQFPQLVTHLIHSRYKKDIGFLHDFGSWAELDLSIKSDILIFNGFSFANEVTPSVEKVFKNQKPVKLDIFGKIPVRTPMFGVLGISNLDQYLKDYSLFMESHGNGSRHKDTLQHLKTQENIDLSSTLQNIFDHEVAFVFLNSQGDTLSKYQYSLIRVKTKEDGVNFLNTIVSAYSDKSNREEKSLIHEEKFTKDEKLKVYELPLGNIPSMLFGKIFTMGGNRYCYVSDNYLVFGSSPQSLVFYENQLQSESSLNADQEFNTFSEYFSSQCNFFFYNQPSKSIDLYNNFFKKEIATGMPGQEDKLNLFKALVYQFNIGENGLIYNNIFLKYSAAGGEKNFQPIWRTSLDGNVLSKPFVLKNEKDSSRNLVVTDDKNQLYLINNAGRILWKVKIPEPIMSDIWPLDYYKNGKIQILFNTKSKIYILDKNGNNVEDYPHTLESRATNGLTLVDYDRKRNYRIILATENNKVNALTKEGTPVEGWDFTHTASIVSQPVMYYKIADKDLLVFTDQQKMYVLDRKGKALIRDTKSYNIPNQTKVSLINSRSINEAKFLFTDSTGQIIETSLNNSSQELQLLNIPSNHWFDVYDVDGDGVKDFIFTWAKILKVVTQKNKELFTINLEKPVSFRPVFYETGKKDNPTEIGVVTSENSNVYLFDCKGNLVKGFPLKGNTQFSIEGLKIRENSFNLTVGSDNNFLFQYSVQ